MLALTTYFQEGVLLLFFIVSKCIEDAQERGRASGARHTRSRSGARSYETIVFAPTRLKHEDVRKSERA